MKQINSIFYFIFCFLIVNVGFFSNTIGFDLYFHVLSVVSYESISTLNFGVDIGGVLFPRYILFHYILYCFSLLCIPPIITISIIQTIAVFYLLKNERNKEPVVLCITIILIVVSCVFWSPASTATVIFFNVIISGRNKPIWLPVIIAVSIHFIGIVYFVIYAFFVKEYRAKLFVLISIVLSCSHFLYSEPNGLCLFQSEVFKYNILEVDNLKERVFYKLKEISILLVFVFFVFYFSKKIKSILNNIANVRAFVLLTSFFLLLFVVVISFFKQSNGTTEGIFSYFMDDMYIYNKSLIEYGWIDKRVIHNECIIMFNRL
ncbi:hypothetical protein [Photobacterium phosphoreum]|uniref:hypothetical protein n=1 Tax=Photobacterium phosphoreum TaxID=659 RepID=UPI001E64B60E|nr:hypothetical protein [Photobacterium phosphoreum]MCD9477283.1 hypothetical protein [Photobacterium phosphoreum]MCF2178099.1 hypothetical protein [Photobacterium phosphoreum]